MKNLLVVGYYFIGVYMAIKQTFKLKQDSTIEILDAYYRIEEIYGTKDKLSIKVAVYTSKENALPGKQLDVFSYLFIPSLEEGSGNFFKQGYEFLMNNVNDFKDGVSDEVVINENIEEEENIHLDSIIDEF